MPISIGNGETEGDVSINGAKLICTYDPATSEYALQGEPQSWFVLPNAATIPKVVAGLYSISVSTTIDDADGLVDVSLQSSDIKEIAYGDTGQAVRVSVTAACTANKNIVVNTTNTTTPVDIYIQKLV